jgi:hypothetical protein
MTGTEASSQNFSFPMEAHHAFGITLERRGRDFRSYLSLSSLIYLTHAALAEQGEDFTVTEFVANGERREYEQVFRGWSENAAKS